MDRVKLTPMVRHALQYVANADGQATSDSFNDDHSPVSAILWHELRFPVRLIGHDPAFGRSQYLILTDAGREVLAQKD